MTVAEDLYERYKDALRTGHVALLRDRLEDALRAYREAAAIAPDRAVPRSGLAGVLVRLGRIDEAIDEYGLALERAPRDEGALLGWAEALMAAGRPAAAAAALDRAAEVQEDADRLPEASDTLRRAQESAPSPARARRLQALVRRLRDSTGDQAAGEALSRALRLLEGPAAEEPAEGEAGITGPAGTAGPDETVGPAAVATFGTAVEVESPKGAAETAAESTTTDPAVLVEAAEEALAGGDATLARDRWIEAAAALGGVGLFEAGLDAAEQALALDPGASEPHLVLAGLYLDHGWRALAARKLRLLDRLLALDGDAAGRERLAARAGSLLDEFPEEASGPAAGAGAEAPAGDAGPG